MLNRSVQRWFSSPHKWKGRQEAHAKPPTACLWLPLAYAFALGRVPDAMVAKAICGAGLLLLVAAAVLAPSWRARRKKDGEP